MKVLVCGGRDYTDEARVFSALDDVALENSPNVTCIIHGNSTGAHSLAGKWARLRGVQEIMCPANWDKLGKYAGIARNERMLELGIDLVVAFPGGRGTADMVRRANWDGVPVRFIGGAAAHPDFLFHE
jgi:predicted Rossmann-fold nucleotide-binding protein